MAVTQNNKALLHRKEWQSMTPAPAATAAAQFVIAADSGNSNIAMLVASATVQHLYHHDEDAWSQIQSGGLAGAFAAGACGVYQPWSNTFTASGGTSTTITVATSTHNICGYAKGKIVEFLTGAAGVIGVRRTITNIDTSGSGVAGSTITLTLDSAVGAAVANGNTFRIRSGRFFVLNAYASLAAGVFKYFDLATMTWSGNLTTTNLPAAWGTDGKMCCAYNFGEIFAIGTATAGGASTLTNSAKAWTANQWTNYQIRITGGTGIGQTRQIASNTGTVITTGSAWTTQPDATSTYEITASEDYIYVLGNNAVTMYRYSVSGNAWTVMAPTTARAAAPGVGMSVGCFGKTGETSWADETNIKDGKYIYSFRGGAGAILDRFDIAGGTAGAGAWNQVVYPNAQETFTTGSSGFVMGRYFYLRKESTNRFFKYSIRGNYIEPLSTNQFPDGTAALGGKIWVKNYDDAGTISWLYSLMNTGTALHRLMLF